MRGAAALQLAVRQAGQAREHAAAVAGDPEAFVEFVHGQRTRDDDDVVGGLQGARGAQAAAGVVGPRGDARGRAVLVHLAGVLVERDGHGLGPELEAALAGDGAGCLAHVVQVVRAGLELVLHVHGDDLRAGIVERPRTGNRAEKGRNTVLIRTAEEGRKRPSARGLGLRRRGTRKARNAVRRACHCVGPPRALQPETVANGNGL